jgi:hypothetical protein
MKAFPPAVLAPNILCAHPSKVQMKESPGALVAKEGSEVDMIEGRKVGLVDLVDFALAFCFQRSGSGSEDASVSEDEGEEGGEFSEWLRLAARLRGLTREWSSGLLRLDGEDSSIGSPSSLRTSSESLSNGVELLVLPRLPPLPLPAILLILGRRTEDLPLWAW